VPGDNVDESEVAVLPVSCDATLDAPDEVPTSTRYDVGEPDAAPHESVTVVPFVAADTLKGAEGAVQGGAPMVSVTSFDAALDPPVLAARTRTKYVPDAMPLAEKLVTVEPVLKFARFERPDAEPASIM
jgi:hypothetical protein